MHVPRTLHASTRASTHASTHAPPPSPPPTHASTRHAQSKKSAGAFARDSEAAPRRKRKRTASDGEGEGALSPAAAKRRAKEKGGKEGAPKPAHDKATEKKLNLWVKAKRTKDWETADKLREELRAAGIDAAAERPARPKPETGAAEAE